MALTTRNFRLGLYLEHIEEIAFLYDQSLTLRRQADFAWRGLDAFEDRLEAHLDALVLGGPLALELCAQRVTEGEPGELFAAVAVFCRHQRSAEFALGVQALATLEAPHRTAFAAALARELPEPWVPHLGAGLNRPHPHLQQTLLDVIALRRLPLVEAIVAAPLGTDAGVCAAAARALGRLRDPQALPVLTTLARHPAVEVQVEALAALLALGETGALERLRHIATQEPAAQTVVALAGGPGALETLLGALPYARTATAAAYGLGLLGDLRAVRPLLQALERPELAPAAAWGLYLITGAPLAGDVFVPDPVNEDELYPHELHALRDHGTAPQRGDGRPFGTLQHRLSLSPAAWQDWLAAHSARFQAGRRFRLGEPAGPASVLHTLGAPLLPDALRQAAGDEARIRYACDLPFETSLPVRHQMRCLRGLSRWLEQHQQRFEAGRWYLAGQALA